MLGRIGMKRREEKKFRRYVPKAEEEEGSRNHDLGQIALASRPGIEQT